MNTKKILSLILAVMMLVSVLSFNTSALNGYPSITVGGLTFQFGDAYDSQYANTSPEQDMQMTQVGTTTVVNVTYNGPISNYFPSELAFYVTNNQNTISGMSGTGVVATPTVKVGDEYMASDNWGIGFYVLSIDTSSAGTKTLTITTTSGTVTLNFTVPEGSTVDSDSIYAYLPAPGQFTNEGCDIGGWGDAFASGSHNLKNMRNNISGTGVSLGYFGGYVVIDMGENVLDSADNMFGIDLIAYGNAFINNAEPGCIQVARAVGNEPGDANLDGVIWYDIANSLYYDSDTATDATFNYTIPTAHKAYNSETSWPYAGAATSPNTSNNVSYQCSPYDALGATSGTVTYNTFHQHAWFPLWANYFVSRTTTVDEETKTIGPLSGATVTDNTLATPTTTEGLPFATYVRDTSAGSTVSLKGVMIKDATATTTSLYRFGFVDAHNNNTNAVMTTHPEYYGRPYNPYAFTSANIESNNTWATFLSTAYKDTTAGSHAGGGDPIDISWAVYPAKYDHTVLGDNNTAIYTKGDANPLAGQPVDLDDIRFVRIYTGAAKMNGIFGEISTEVCGVYKAVTGTNTGTTDSIKATIKHGDDTLSNGGTDISDTQKFISQSITAGTDYTFTVHTSSSNYLFINGTQITGATSTNPHTITINLSAGETKTYQIITQTGLRQPYIEVITFTGSGT